MMYASFVACTIIIISLLVLLLFPDIYVNKYIKNRIINEFITAYPGYSIIISGFEFNLLKNSIEIGSLSIKSEDSTFSCNIGKSAVKEINWLKFLFEGFPVAITGTLASVEQISLKFTKQEYEYQCGLINVSFPDSEVLVQDLGIQPIADDQQYFETSEFRKKRFNLVIPKLKLSGLDFSDLLQGKKYHTRFLQIVDASLDVLVNMYKPNELDTIKPLMVNEMLSSIRENLQIDSLSILNFKVKYGESYSDVNDIIDGYEFDCASLKASLNDSDLVAKNLYLHPLMDDYQYFDASKFRRTRYNIVVPKIKLSGVDFIGLMQGKKYHSRFIKMEDASLDFLVNMSKPNKQDTTKPLITNEYLSSIKEKIQIDSISILNGKVKYGERYSERSGIIDGYEFQCASLQASIHDSNLIVKNLEIEPLLSDTQYFDNCKFRRTRFSTFIPQIIITGLDCNGLLSGKKYNASHIQIHDASLNVLVNMYKPYKREIEKSLMPNEMLKSIKEIIQVDSLSLINSRLKYCETYAARSKPGVITFDKMNLLAEGLSNNNQHGDTVVIHANATFMNSGLMKAILYVPLTSPQFSLKYSGSLARMDLNKLNSFIEIAEHKRIKSGVIQEASFNIQVKNGKASGYVRAEYNDLKLAILDSKTGSENGLWNKLKSLLANNFKINGSNQKDKDGILKLAKVNYLRQHDDTFIQFAWFALRTGVGNVVGF